MMSSPMIAVAPGWLASNVCFLDQYEIRLVQ